MAGRVVGAGPSIGGYAPGRASGRETAQHGLSGAFVVDKVDKVIINTPEMA
jgi:hypothetical protein